MLRTHTCGELRLVDVNKLVTLSGWVQRVRNKGGLIWVDLGDRYGLTQLIFEEGSSDEGLLKKAGALGREFVIQAKGKVIERTSKNDKLPTGEIEVKVSQLEILNRSKVPPCIIEDETDGGEDLRMRYRYLDLRRKIVREKLQLRHRMMQETRKFMDSLEFMEVETPVLIKRDRKSTRLNSSHVKISYAV